MKACYVFIIDWENHIQFMDYMCQAIGDFQFLATF